MASLARRLLRRSERNTLAQKLRLWLESSGSHRELLLLLGAMRDDELGEVHGLAHLVDDKVHDVR